MSKSSLTLSGDENVPAMPLTDSQVNHLRRLLAWMDCEWMLIEDRQIGFVGAAKDCIEKEMAAPGRVEAVMAEQAAKTAQCPAYVRQAVKMLTKAIRDHERASGIVDPKSSSQVREDNQGSGEPGRLAPNSEDHRPASAGPVQRPVGRQTNKED